MPPKPKPTTDELVEALLDTKVVEALAKALSPVITLAIGEVLGKRLEGMATTIHDMKGEISCLTKQCEELTKDNVSLRKTVGEQNIRVDELERYSRTDNIIIRGLPEQSSAERASAIAVGDNLSTMESNLSVEKTVVSFLKESLNIDVTPHDI